MWLDLASIVTCQPCKSRSCAADRMLSVILGTNHLSLINFPHNLFLYFLFLCRLFRGRAFRCGFSSEWLIVHPGKPLTQPDTKSKKLDDDSMFEDARSYSLLPSATGNDLYDSVLAKPSTPANPFTLYLEKIHCAPFCETTMNEKSYNVVCKIFFFKLIVEINRVQNV